jgi:predicted ester cyclase
MSTEENKALIRRFFAEVVSGGNFALVEELLAPEYVLHFTGAPGPLDREGFKGFLGGFRAAFPDMQDSIDDMVADGETVGVRGTTRGTHQGEFQGIAATGKAVQVGWMSMLRITGGRIIEDYVNFDNVGLMQQLGVIPAPEQASV